MEPDAISEESRRQRLIRNALGLLPLALGITGGTRDALLRFGDLITGPAPPLTRVVTAEGHTLLLRGDEGQERLLGYALNNVQRYYRRSPLARLLTELRAPDALFVDVGANLGMYCLLARDLGYQTLAIEPEPRHVDFLQRHEALLGPTIPVAVSDAPGVATLYVSNQENTGASSLNGSATSRLYDGTIKVPLRRLEDLLDEHVADPTRLRLIKIDVEGHEAAALRGLTGFLDQGHRPQIFCEVRGPDSGRAPSSYRDAIEILSPYGYTASHYDHHGAVPFRGERTPQVFDLLFRPA